MKKTYQIEVDCANCANKMEEEAKKITGITNASINFVTQKFVVDFAEDSDPKSLFKEIVKRCKKIDRDFTAVELS